MKILLIVALCCSALTANAKGGSVVTPAPGGFNVKFASNGTPLAVASSGGANPVLMGTAAFAIPVVGNNTMAGVATGLITAAAAATGWGGLALAIGGLAIAAIPVIKNWMASNNVTARTDGRYDIIINDIQSVWTTRALYGGAYSTGPAAADACGASATLQGGGVWSTSFTITQGANGSVCNFVFNHSQYGQLVFSQGLTETQLPNGSKTIAVDLPDVINRMTVNPPTPAAVQELVERGYPPEVEPTKLEIPKPTMTTGTTTATNPDGSQKVTEEKFTCVPFGATLIRCATDNVVTSTKPETTSTLVVTAPDGSTSTAIITKPKTTETTTETTDKPPQTTCGLPGSPACKIDETGTATGPADTFTQPKADIDTAKTAAETAIGNAASISAPVWSFTFQLPTGCAPYVTGIRGVILNVCQYQSTIHGLLSAIWAAATIFCMIGMVGRTIRES